MGLTTGHVFSDGDTVTAAKLNAMVNNATISADTVTSSMLSDDVIESRHIADGAITSNHIASGAVSLGIISSETSAPGTIIQSGSGGTWEELSPGAAGMLLTSNGADTALTFGLLGSASLGNTLISGLVEHENPIVGDLLMVKDTVAGVNKHTTIQGVLNSMTGLGLIDSNDIASDDEVMVYDKSTTTAKRMLWSEFVSTVSIPFYTQDSGTIDTLTNMSVTFAHGLGATPTRLRVTIVCVSSEHGYATGDELELSSFSYVYGDTQIPFASIYSNSTTIGIDAYGNSGSNLYVQPLSSSVVSLQICTKSKWKYRVRSWLDD